MCESARVWRGPVHGHPLLTCVHGMTMSGQKALCVVRSEQGNSSEQELQVTIFAGLSDR